MENGIGKSGDKDMENSMENGMEKQYKYDAFISYRHVEPDQTIAKEIHRMIEGFKPPKEFYKSGKLSCISGQRGACGEGLKQFH